MTNDCQQLPLFTGYPGCTACSPHSAKAASGSYRRKFMAIAEPANNEVVSLVDYLRETIAEIDSTVSGWHARRTALALRLAALEAATDPEVLAAAEDFDARVAEGRPYEGAQSVADLVKEAHARYVT